MADPIDIYSQIQGLVQLDIQNAIKGYTQQSKYGVEQIPAHQHTGTDSLQVSYKNILDINYLNTLLNSLNTFGSKVTIFYDTVATGGMGSPEDKVYNVGFTVNQIMAISWVEAGTGPNWGFNQIVSGQDITLWGANVYSGYVIYIDNGGGSTATATWKSNVLGTGFKLTWQHTGAGCTVKTIFICIG